MPSPGLVARTSKARRSLERLARIASISWDEYASNEDLQFLAERHLHIVLEVILDLAGFIAARRGLSRGPTYRDVMESLVANKVIPPELSQLALQVPGMRNLLVHGYAEIRHDIIYEALKKELKKLAMLVKELETKAEELDP